MTEMEKLKKLVERAEGDAQDAALVQMFYRQVTMSAVLLDKDAGEIIVALLKVLSILMWKSDSGRKENEETFESAAGYLMSTCELNCRAREENHGG